MAISLYILALDEDSSNDERLDRVLALLGARVAVEGILFHALNEPDSGLYVRHLVAELSGALRGRTRPACAPVLGRRVDLVSRRAIKPSYWKRIEAELIDA